MSTSIDPIVVAPHPGPSHTSPSHTGPSHTDGRLPPAEVAERLAVYLAGMPADVRESALQAYRGVTLALLVRRKLGAAEAEAAVDRIVTAIRARLALIERAGGALAGRA